MWCLIHQYLQSRERFFHSWQCWLLSSQLIDTNHHKIIKKSKITKEIEQPRQMITMPAASLPLSFHNYSTWHLCKMSSLCIIKPVAIFQQLTGLRGFHKVKLQNYPWSPLSQTSQIESNCGDPPKIPPFSFSIGPGRNTKHHSWWLYHSLTPVSLSYIRV